MRKINKGLKAVGLLAAISIGAVSLDSINQHSLDKEYKKISAIAYDVGFDNYGVSTGPIKTKGVQDCGICILVSPAETWMSHFGFDSCKPEKANFDTSYIKDMVRAAKDKPTEAYLVGGDDRYLERLRNVLSSLSIKTRVLYCDEVRADEPYEERNRKDILVLPEERKIIIEQNGRYKKIKY